jgi:hydroxyacylglutathione hydrolase
MIVPVTPFQQNCTVMWNEATMRGAVVDPGGDLPRILEAVDQAGIAIEKVLLTHGHVDHAAAAAATAKHFAVPIEGPHRLDAFLIEGLPEQAARYGFPPSAPFTPDRWLDQGDEVTVGGMTFAVRHCPGHTPGHVIFFQAETRFALVGDVLFRGSVGRTDLPRGDFDALIRSVREQLWPLGDDVAFIPGHGPTSTFGEERRTNPFVADRRFR